MPACAGWPGERPLRNRSASGQDGTSAGTTRALRDFHIDEQPDDVTCGPTCLHALYRHFGDTDITLEQTIAEVNGLDEGGTLAVFLGCHALRRGYRAQIYTYNLHVFDPTWFDGPHDLVDRLQRQAELKADAKLRTATQGYVEFLRLGGRIRLSDLTRARLRNHLTEGRPILTGLSATYLHRSMREFGPECDEDDLRGGPVGHFVVLYGYDRQRKLVRIADPMTPNPLPADRLYAIPVDRVLGAILLGVLTYDANLLVIEPPDEQAR